MESERHAFAIRGGEAEVKWGYHLAARLSRWSFAGSASAGGQVAATVVAGSRDAFRLRQRPLTLVLHLMGYVDGPGTVKWPVLDIVDSGANTVTVVVGPVLKG